MSQPIIKYTLTKQGRQPEWLSKDSRAFKGEHSAPANKPGKLPRFGSPQDTIFLGIGAGDPDSDGTPDGYVGTIDSKADLQTYITGIGTAAGYKVVTPTLTGVTTSVTTGELEAWNPTEDYSGPGLTTTTSDKVTSTGTGTIQTFEGSQVTKVVIETTTEISGVSTTTTITKETAINVDPASTVSAISTSDSVGIVTTTLPDEGGIQTVKTTTTTSAFTYTDVITSTSTSTSSTTTDGETTRTDTVTTTETTNYVTDYDYAAEATRLWDIHQAINS